MNNCQIIDQPSKKVLTIETVQNKQNSDHLIKQRGEKRENDLFC